MLMREIEYEVRGFLTVRRDSLRVPLSGSLAVHLDPDSGRFDGDLVLRPATTVRKLFGVSLVSSTVDISPAGPVSGQLDHDGAMFATVTVDAIIAAANVGGLTLINGDTCRTATHAVVPLQSKPGFDLDRGGRLTGRYQRPPFTGCGRLTPLVNLLISGPGNAAVIDLVPVSP
jgi:hypothetical protein